MELLQESLAQLSALVDGKLSSILLDVSCSIPSKAELIEAASYALSGGKRLRPILALVTTEMFGKPIDKALSTASALELIHAYSLIHDDLPCMDDDDFRRGKPTVHKAFGEGLAVLTGDFLNTLAFEVIARDEQLSFEQRIDLICLISKHAGIQGMIGGQVMDIAAQGKEIAFEDLKCIHRCKTGALITASIVSGGIVAEAHPSEIDILKNFGEKIGLAFQIADDILDVTASEKKHGKKIASDVINGKPTYMTFMSLDSAWQEAENWLQSALHELKMLSCDTTLLESLAKRLVNRTF